MAFLEIENLSKTFGTHTVLHQFDLNIERGEFITFLGPSGCGKTTVLRMIAGFETATRGSIRLDGRDVTYMRTRQRKVGMVFQSYALFPNMTIADNIGFGLKVLRRPQAEIKQRVEEMLHLIKLPTLGERYPWQLSGGQQQRVALARALAGKPQVLLLDEPLSALDAKIRVSLREDIRALQRELGITSIFVTHDQEEALSISDRIVVMNEGRVEQIGTPSEIYNSPRTRFVASFVGTLNVLSGQIIDPASGKIVVAGQELRTSHALNASDAGKQRTLAVRPEAIVLEAPANGRNTLAATVEEVNFLGAVVRIRARVNEAVISLDIFNDPNRRLPERGQPVALGFSHENLLVLEEGT
jgi:putative spermidine/putrescine transport system ATP-binding protein